MQIKENPLNIATPVEKPTWICAHPDAKVLDIELKRFLCFVCNIFLLTRIIYTISNSVP